MPTYEYECTACHARHEEFQQMTSKPSVVCPKCGKRKLKRLIGAGSGILFKGSGFYSTDYRSSTYQQSAKADSPSAAASTDSKSSDAKSSDSKSSEAKPAEAKPAEKSGSGKKKAAAAK